MQRSHGLILRAIAVSVPYILNVLLPHFSQVPEHHYNQGYTPSPEQTRQLSTVATGSYFQNQTPTHNYDHESQISCAAIYQNQTSPLLLTLVPRSAARQSFQVSLIRRSQLQIGRAHV